MDLCHYNFTVFEARHYFSRNYASAITIHLPLEIRHYVRLTPCWAQLQAYPYAPPPPYFHMDQNALAAIISLHSLTCGPHMSSPSFSSPRLPQPRRSPHGLLLLARRSATALLLLACCRPPARCRCTRPARRRRTLMSVGRTEGQRGQAAGRGEQVVGGGS